MKQENWLLCHVHAFDYLGGVPRLLIPDNAKTATITNIRYEVVLNRSYQELAEHYGTAIVLARVRRLDDKATAEGSLKYVSTWITVALRDRKFFTLEGACRAAIEKLEELNRRPFKKRAGCRFFAFEEKEREFMRSLPATPYESSVWSHLKVSYDYLVSGGRNKYSAPYDLIVQIVDLRLTRNLVKVYFHGARGAVHVRLAAAQRDPVVKPEHMPEVHRKYLGYNEHEFTTWAAGVGLKTLDVVRYFLSHGREVEQGYKACAILTKLENIYGAARLESACTRVLDLSSAPTIRNISALCKAATERKPEENDSDERQDNRYGISVTDTPFRLDIDGLSCHFVWICADIRRYLRNYASPNTISQVSSAVNPFNAGLLWRSTDLSCW